MSESPPIDEAIRYWAPRVLGTLVRRHGDFDACEDAVQEALLAASVQWPEQGVPENVWGWLLTVATRRLADHWRSEFARRRREETVASLIPPAELVEPNPADAELPEQDDTLTLLFLCCHPALTPASQLALTLRAGGGLTTAQIARAFFVPEETMAQRISRAKGRIKATGRSFPLPLESEREDRLRVVLQVLYLMFNEGYTSTFGPDLQQSELTSEAIRLTRAVHRHLPDDGEVAGLLALMLLTDARRPARTRADGSLVPLAEQDRTRWQRASIDEGIALISETLARAAIGPYQLQAAIAAIHAEAADADQTDWAQILALYELHARLFPNPMVTLNHAVALAMVNGAKAGLDLLVTLDGDEHLAGHHRVEAVRGHLLEMDGDFVAALVAYRLAAQRTTSLPERRYLEVRAGRCRGA